MKKINCILLIDDNPNDNYLHYYTIEEADVCNHLETVYDAEEALLYLKNSDLEGTPKPDLILLDMNLPGMDGVGFLDEFKNIEEEIRAGIVIIILTSSDDSMDMNRVMKIKEVKEFIGKPLDSQSLNRIIAKYFN